MTLITYQNRVHFADNVLEEALWAELDRRPERDVFVLTDPPNITGDMSERFRSGLPARKRVHVFSKPVDVPTEDYGRELAAQYQDLGCGPIVAFGPGSLIDQAKVVRLLVSQPRRLDAYSVSEGGALRITAPLPDMIAVPTLPGFSSGLTGLASVRLTSGKTIDLASADLIPTVSICDPVLALGTSPETQASAGVTAIARCIEALLSPAYNPPADGIALDGLTRALRSIIPATQTRELDPRREIMAASLNAALVQQKGLGLIYAISSAIDAATRRTTDSGAVARLLLPEILGFYMRSGMPELRSLNDALHLDGLDAPDALRTRLSGLPLPGRLSDMGIATGELDRVASLASHHRAVTNGPRRPKSSEILSMLRAVH